MGYKIQNVEMWDNGSLVSANYIDMYIVHDNLKDFAQFLYILSNVTEVENSESVKVELAKGNATISGEKYDEWGNNADINLSAYEIICNKLNINLIN